MIHYAIEYDENGLPCRLVWSSAYQGASDEHERNRLQRKAEQKRKAELPMPSMIEWAKQRGLTK